MNCKLIVSLAAILLIGSTASWAADDGAALDKSKCAGCHGTSGEGKPAIKGTKLGSDELVTHITKGEATSKAPHNKGIAGLTDDQANAIAEYIKALK